MAGPPYRSQVTQSDGQKAVEILDENKDSERESDGQTRQG